MRGRRVHLSGELRTARLAALVTGDGRWYQDWNFQFWVEIDGQRAKWSPHNYRGSLDWQEILIPVCGEYIEKTQRVFRADHFPP